MTPIDRPRLGAAGAIALGLLGVVLATANARKDWPADRYPPLVDALESDQHAHTPAAAEQVEEDPQIGGGLVTCHTL